MLAGNRLGRHISVSGENKPRPTPFSCSPFVPQNSQTQAVPSEQASTGSYDALLKAVWCPICGGKLTVREKDGKKTLVCSRHGEMKVFLDKDPKAGGE